MITLSDETYFMTFPTDAAPKRRKRRMGAFRFLFLAFFIPILAVPIILSSEEPLTGLVYESPYKHRNRIIREIPELEKYIREEMGFNGIMGLSIAVFDKRGVIYKEGFGSRNASGRKHTDTNTVFQAASLGKAVTAYAVLMLVDRGQLYLDAPAQSYLPEPFIQDDKFADTITIRMLLNHTSGMKNDPDGFDRHVYFPPGSAFSYSGAGFRYLQAVIEAVTGMSAARFVENEIMKPLGMNSSTFLPEEYHSLPLQEPLPNRNLKANAAYTLVSTPSDMTRFLRELQSPSLVNGYLVMEMLSPSVRVNSHNSWGLGIGLQDTPAGETVWHWGKNSKSHNSLMVMDVGTGIGCVVMASGEMGEKIIKKVVSHAIGGFHYGYWEDIPANLVYVPEYRNDIN